MNITNKLMKSSLLLAISIASAACISIASAEKMAEPITELAKASITQAATKKASLTQPLEIKDLETAKKHLQGDTLKAVKKLDFSKVKLLLFTWQGSGQDKLNYTVAKSSPEQISFSFQRGLTRDLRSHTKLFVLRQDVSFVAPK